jgi:hypothetical protein
MQEIHIFVSNQIGGETVQLSGRLDLASGVGFELPLEVHLFLFFVVFFPLWLALKSVWRLLLV